MMVTVNPSACAGADNRCMMTESCTSVGLTRTPIRAMVGTASLINSSRLPTSASSPAIQVPVTCPPGRDALDGAAGDRVLQPDREDGNRARDTAHSEQTRLRRSDDHVRLETDQLGGQRWHTFGHALGTLDVPGCCTCQQWRQNPDERAAV